jgi:hypothetical protein
MTAVTWHGIGETGLEDAPEPLIHDPHEAIVLVTTAPRAGTTPDPYPPAPPGPGPTPPGPGPQPPNPTPPGPTPHPPNPTPPPPGPVEPAPPL